VLPLCLLLLLLLLLLLPVAMLLAAVSHPAVLQCCMLPSHLPRA
jgi:hypothetical protein